MKLCSIVSSAGRLLVIVVAVFHARPTSGFSSGAGGCAGGGPAVGQPHFLVDATQRSFAAAGLQFTAGGQLVDGVAGADDVVLASDADITFAVQIADTTDAMTTSSFKGALIRVEQGSDASVFTLVADSTSSEALACQLVPTALGVTHTSSSDKTVLSGVFRTTSTVSDVTVDVTVVTSNNFADGSVYSYQQFVLAVVEDPTMASVPTESPVVAPTESPVVAPTDSPVVAPTDSPVVAPTDSPVAAPSTDSPVIASSTDSPVVAPTDSPVAFSPTGGPLSPVTDSPVLVTPTTERPVASTTTTPESPVLGTTAVPSSASPVVAAVTPSPTSTPTTTASPTVPADDSFPGPSISLQDSIFAIAGVAFLAILAFVIGFIVL